MGGILSASTAACLKRQSQKANRSRDIPEFSEQEKRVIRSSWTKLQQKSPQVAADIFLRIFQLRPDVKQFFPFKSAVGEALVSHPYFKGHSVRFLNAVGMTVANLEALEVIHVPNLRKLGQYHTRIPGFSHDIFQVFCEAMNDVWAKYLGRSYSGETRVAWGRIFRFIVDQVEIGYQEAVTEADRRSAAAVARNGVHSSPAHSTHVPHDSRGDQDTSAASKQNNSTQLDGSNQCQNETMNGNTNGSRSAVTGSDVSAIDEPIS